MAKPPKNAPDADFTPPAGYELAAGTGEIHKWEIGMVVQGALVGMRPGNLGTLVDIKDEEGEIITYGCPTILRNLLEPINKGDDILIYCSGKKASTKGQDTWVFRLYSKS